MLQTCVLEYTILIITIRNHLSFQLARMINLDRASSDPGNDKAMIH